MTLNQSGPIRITAFFSGRVQGVGFRNHVHRNASTFPKIGAGKGTVTGYVQNLEDGRVKVVAEGKLSDLERFLDLVSNPTAGSVSKVDRFQSEASYEFNSFEIRW